MERQAIFLLDSVSGPLVIRVPEAGLLSAGEGEPGLTVFTSLDESPAELGEVSVDERCHVDEQLVHAELLDRTGLSYKRADEVEHQTGVVAIRGEILSQDDHELTRGRTT